MESLPRDVFLTIFDYLVAADPKRKCTRYASVPRRFQHATERRTFQSFSLRLSAADCSFSQFTILFRPSQAYRPGLIKAIHLNVELPDCDDEARARCETKDEKEANDGVFRTLYTRVFRVLKTSYL